MINQSIMFAKSNNTYLPGVALHYRMAVNGNNARKRRLTGKWDVHYHCALSSVSFYNCSPLPRQSPVLFILLWCWWWSFSFVLLRMESEKGGRCSAMLYSITYRTQYQTKNHTHNSAINFELNRLLSVRQFSEQVTKSSVRPIAHPRDGYPWNICVLIERQNNDDKQGNRISRNSSWTDWKWHGEEDRLGFQLTCRESSKCAKIRAEMSSHIFGTFVLLMS